MHTKPTFTCSNSIIDTPEQQVRIVQSKQKRH